MTKKKKSKPAVKEKKTERNSFDFDKFLQSILKPKWAVPVLFLFLSVVYFSDFFFSDKVLYTTDGGYIGTSAETAEFWSDHTFSKFSVWNNLMIGGYPSDQGLFIYTQGIILVFFFKIFPPNQAQAAYLITLMFFAAYFAYLYLISLKLTKLTAVLGGIFYMFAPMLLSMLLGGHFSRMSAIVFMPLMFFFIEKAFDTGKPKYILYLSGSIALPVLSSHLQMAYYSFWAVGFYFIYKLINSYFEDKNVKFLLKRSVFFSLAVVFGLCMASRAFVPQYWHTRTQSKRAQAEVQQNVQQQTDDDKFAFASSYPLNPEEVMALVLPNFSGYTNAELNGDYWGRNFLKLNSEYFGVLPFLLFLAGLFLIKKDKRIAFFTVLFSFAILFALGGNTPVFRIFFHIIPGMKVLRGPSMISFLFSFSAIVVGCILLDNFMKQEKYHAKLMKYMQWIFIAFIGLALLLVLIPDQFLSMWKTFFNLEAKWPPGSSAGKNQVLSAHGPVVSSNALILLGISIVVFIMFRLYSVKKMNIGLLVILLALINILDTWRIDKDFMRLEPERIGQHYTQIKIPALENLKAADKSPYRVFPEFELPRSYGLKALYDGVAYPFGFSDFTIQRFNQIQNKFLNDIRQKEQINFPILNLLNVKYYVSEQERQIPNLVLKSSDNQLKVYENQKAFPYYSFVHSYISVNSDQAAYQSVISNIANGITNVVLEEPVPEEYQKTSEQDSTAAEDVVEFLDMEDFYKGRKSKFQFRVSSEQPGFLVLSDNYYPGWVATVDGEEQKIFRANYLWKGVFVPAGKHEVTFEYKPRLLLASTKLSASSILLFLALVIASFIYDFKKKNEE